MKCFVNSKIKLLFLGLVIALVPGGRSSKADFVFGEPTNLGPTINSSTKDLKSNISADGLTLFFVSTRPGGYGGRDIWATTRDTTDDEWGNPINLGTPINTSSRDSGPSISADGLSLFFDSDRPGGYGTQDIWVSTRPTLCDPWGEPVNLGGTVNSPYAERAPSISADGLELFLHSDRPSVSGGDGTQDLWVTTRKTTNDAWGPPVNLGLTVNSGTFDGAPSISSDGLSLFFMSAQAGGYGALDMWVTRRATINDAWGKPANLGANANSTDDDWGPSISADGCLLFFGSDRPGGLGDLDMWQASITPVVDFNADGIVDILDLSIMVHHWGKNYSLCDIGPTPLGDGIVDIQDLVVLAKYIEPLDRTLIAHWALDEIEGIVARDSAGDNDGHVLGGEALWRPGGGKVNGALEFTGTTFIMGGFVLNPSAGPCSVLAWVKGGQPGQGIITQQGGVDWLMADAAEGKLATDLSRALCSQTVITDGDWHRLGVTWDGSVCLLYVDGALEAESTEDGLTSSTGGVVIGCRRIMALGTFWTGLLDDVRIYNRAVKP